MPEIIVQRRRVLLASLIVILLTVFVSSFCGGNTGMFFVNWHSKNNPGNTFANKAALIGLSIGMLCGLAWCLAMLRHTKRGNLYVLKTGVNYGLLAGITCTVMLHLVLMYGTGRWFWGNMLFGLAFGAVAGLGNGFVCGALWERIVCRPLIQTSEPSQLS